MKKSLQELVTPDNNESPDNSFGAFTNVESGQAKIDLDKLRNYEIFFATPCYGGMITDQYFLSMFKLSQAFMQYGISFRITTLRNESLVTRARNILAAMFMESTASHLFFIDADIEFDEVRGEYRNMKPEPLYVFKDRNERNEEEPDAEQSKAALDESSK